MDFLARIDRARLPQHVAIIMDGNGRWARKRGLPRLMGHRAGVKSVREAVETAASLGLRVLTLYAFSSENWSRPRAEVQALMRLLREYLRKEVRELNDQNIRLEAIGRVDALPEAARKELDRAREATRKNTGLILVLALNYGGRQEIVEAIRRIPPAVRAEIDERRFSQFLDTAAYPDPELLIRTSGEMRLSNFLLWQAAYTELWVTDVLWPDFRKRHFHEALIDYQKRERRFGGLG